MDTAERLDGRALLAIAIALLTWSSAYAAIAYALPAFTPGEVAFARLLIGSLCFAALLRVKHVPLPTRRDWPQLTLLGVLGLTVYHLCLNYAETRIASGTAAILISLVPAATAVVSACWIGERLTLRTWLGLAVALLGTVLVVLASGQRVEFDPLALLVLVCVLVSAVYFVGQKAMFARSSMLGVTAFTFYAGTLAAVPFGWQLPQALAGRVMGAYQRAAVAGHRAVIRGLPGLERGSGARLGVAGQQLHLPVATAGAADRLAVVGRGTERVDRGRWCHHHRWGGAGERTSPRHSGAGRGVRACER